jgi:RecB family exonuclease
MLRKLGVVTVLDLDDAAPAVRRVLVSFEARAEAVRVALAHDADPARGEVFAAAEQLRAQLLERGYVETTVEPDLFRPPGLREAERRLFRADAHRADRLIDANGLALLGAPQGDGVGLVVAREVKRRLDEGVAAEDILVLVRRWDEDAEAVRGVLRAWGLPISEPGRPRRLATGPAVSALRLALSIPVEGWEAAGIARLLRHGRFRPDWPEARSRRPSPPADLAARAASAVRDSRVFRGLDRLRKALDRAENPDPEAVKKGFVRRLAPEVRALNDRLTAELGGVDRPGSWREHTDRLRRLSRSLGLDRGGGANVPPANDDLEHLWQALDDHAAVLEGLGQGGATMPLAAFAEDVDRLVNDLVVTGPCACAGPGTVALAAVDEAAGARARFVILANLSEGAFPTRDAVEAGDGETVGPAYAREMSRFLRVVGSADERLTLAYPTRDEKGQEVLPAGFLDDLVRLFDARAIEAVHEAARRFDPALLDRGDLAGAPADARVRAVALACSRRDAGALRGLAADPRHRPALDGAAEALALTHRRFVERAFTSFDGRLSDSEAVAAIAERFGPDYAFSPSQLETYLFCPFQFFMKYVLGLLPVDDRDELDEDFTGRGSRVHRVLELLETLRSEQGGDRLELAPVVIQTEMHAELTFDSDADPGLNRIESRRLEKTVRDYVRQAADYERRIRGQGPPPEPRHFEVPFGDPDRDGSLPHLVIGDGAEAVKVRGTIDRVDVTTSDEELSFRVIDYKTGHCPSKDEVKSGVALQLPIYALAAERLLLANQGGVLRELGYWHLRERGYAAVADRDGWWALQATIEGKVVDTVGRLRRGLFVIQPRKDDCTRLCDFSGVCRVAQVRSARKGREDGLGPGAG